MNDVRIIVGVLAAACFPAVVRATVLTTASDAFIDSNAPSNNASNASGATSLHVKKNVSSVNNRLAFIGFNTAPLSTAITDATLTFTADGVGGNGAVGEVVSLYAMPEGTPEKLDLSTITWTSASTSTPGVPALATFYSNTNVNGSSPASDPVQSAAYSYLTFMGSLTLNESLKAGSKLSFSTPELVAYLAGDTNGLSMFLLTSETPNGNGNFSVAGLGNTAQSPPVLITNAPEPASTITLISWVTGCLLRRRRR